MDRHPDLGGRTEVGVVEDRDHPVGLQLGVGELVFGLDHGFGGVVVGERHSVDAHCHDVGHQLRRASKEGLAARAGLGPDGEVV